MKKLLLTLFSNLSAKTAVTAALCLVTGAAVTAGVTTAIHQKKDAGYEETIARMEEESAKMREKISKDQQPSDVNVRVFDGRVQVWDGTQWVDKGSVEEVASRDPLSVDEEKKNATEEAVLSKKLDELGYTKDENGNVTAKDAEGNAAKGGTEKLTVGTNAQTKNETASSGKKTKQTQAAADVITALPMATVPANETVNTTWTSQPSSGGGGGGGSSWQPPEEDSSEESAPVQSSAPASTPAATVASAPATETPAVPDTPTPTNEGQGFDESGDWSDDTP
ncbi:MAG: hypothetical protein IKS87_03250 [Lachnospiraceae bacterium]|nr:hypothetical protein [Lachnospiraceae bacterium]